MEQLKSHEVELSPLQIIRQYVTEGWIHPALSQQTLKHRSTAKARLSKVLIDQNIPTAELVAAMVGSVHWAVDDDSDYDYVVCCVDPRNASSLKQASIDKGQDSSPLSKALNRSNIDFHWGKSVVVVDDVLNNPQDNSRIIATILYTPDEYILGNVSLAQKLRLKLTQNPNLDWEEISAQYKHYYADWGILDMWSDRGTHYQDRSREKRLDEVLAAIAKTKNDPIKFIQDFSNWKKTLSFPKQDIYRAAMQESNGKLSLILSNSDSDEFLITGKKTSQINANIMFAALKRLLGIR